MSELLGELRAGGVVEAEGRFTLDADKAREKLRQYQLADPHRYVLLLVEAMSLAGARQLEFAIDADDVRLRCIGRPFRYEQLADLYASLFVEVDATLEARERDHLRGLQQLAFALNSAMALNPRFIRLESVDAEGRGVALVLEPERPDQLTRIEKAEPGTRIHVRDRFRPGLVVEFFRSIGGGVAEQKLLRKHCRWSPLTIVLDGETISGPLEFEGEAWYAEPITIESRTIGRAAIHMMPRGAAQLGPAHVDLLCNGVWIERVELEGMVAGFAAIVDDGQLRRDVSQTQVLRDATFERLVAHLQAIEAKLVARLAERWLEARARDQAGPVWAEPTLREWLGKRPSAGLTRPSEDPSLLAVTKVPLWRGLADARLTTLDLIETDPLYYTRQPFGFCPRELTFVLDLCDDEEYELFAKLFGKRGFDSAPTLQRIRERDRQRTNFLSRQHPAQLAEGYYLRREPVVGKLAGTDTSITGEIGLRSLGHRDSWVRLVREGCLLQELAIGQPIPGLCGVVEAEFTANDDWDRALADERLAQVAFELLRSLERMLAALASSGAADRDFELRELLRAYVRASCDPCFVLVFLDQFGFGETEARALLRKFEPVGLSPAWGLDIADGRSPHPIAKVPLYAQARGLPLALVDLLAWRREGLRIAWLDHDVGPLPELDRPVVLLDSGDRAVLRELFGDEAFDRYHDRLSWFRQRETFLLQPKRALDHGQTTLVTTPLLDPRLRGELGLREFSARAETINASSIARVRVFHRERELCKLDLGLPLPGLIAWVDSDQLEVDAEFRQLVRIGELRPALFRATVEVVRIELERARREPRALRRCEFSFLQRSLALLFGAEGLLRAWVDLRGGGAASEFVGLLRLYQRWPARELERGLGRLRGRGELPTPAEVERQLGHTNKGPSESEAELAGLRLGLAGLLDELLAVPLVRAMVDDRASAEPIVGCAELIDRWTQAKTIAWVHEGFRIDRMPEAAGRVLVLDPIEHRILAAMFGAPALEDLSDWLSGRARFERRARVDAIRLPTRQALVQIALAERGVRGELGLVRESPAAAGRSRIRVFHLGREITTLDLPADPLAMVGALEFDTLELTPSHDGLTPLGRERVRSEVARHDETLLAQLLDAYPQLAGGERALAAELLRRVLVQAPPASGGYVARAKRAPKRFARLAELPIFPGARRPWTASELAEAAGRGSIATIEARVDRPLPEGPVIVLERADLLDTLVALFGRTRNLASEWAQQDAIARIKAAAPRMPDRPGRLLASIEVGVEALTGELWWAPGIDYSIALGREGRRFGKRAAPELFPCAGALEGPGLAMKGDWSQASPSRGQEAMIDQGAHDLWSAMIDEFERLDASPSRETESRHASLREALRGQFLRLHAAGAGKRSGKQKRKARNSPRNKIEGMYRRLWSLKLLRLAAGHHVSAEVAARERPIELAGLELWQGLSAEELNQRAAAERKQAEERRAAELEARRRDERERRQTEQAAQREAAGERKRREQLERAQAERERTKPAPAKPAPAKPQSKSRADARAPTAQERLLDAICNELRLVRGKRSGLLANHHLESLVMVAAGRGPLFEASVEASESGAGKGEVRVNAEHPLVVAALAAGLADPTPISLLASATYTFLNLIHTEISDEDEAEFLRLHAAHARSRE